MQFELDDIMADNLNQMIDDKSLTNQGLTPYGVCNNVSPLEETGDK